MNWVKAKLGEIAEVLSGSTPDSGFPKYWGGENVWLTPTDLGKLVGVHASTSLRYLTDEGVRSCNLPIVPEGAVVISSRAPIGHLAIAGCHLHTNQGCKSFVCSDVITNNFLYFLLRYRTPELQQIGSGATFAEVSKSTFESLEISFPERIEDQIRIAADLHKAFGGIDAAKKAAETQLNELAKLSDRIISHSLQRMTQTHFLSEVLNEVKNGVGNSWNDFSVLGATRSGLAPAKEPPGKHPGRYKPVSAGTVFYNPMRILIGSIAFVDDDDEPGITSPDYVVLKGKPGVVDSRWFYYWLRSPLGERCIQSLARGAVRERMLFNRLAAGEIALPDYATQLKASQALAHIKPMRAALQTQLAELELLPQKLLAQVFEAN